MGIGHKAGGHRTQSQWTRDTKPVDTGHKIGGHGVDTRVDTRVDTDLLKEG